MTLPWSFNPPTKPGWYWISSPWILPEVVHVVIMTHPYPYPEGSLGYQQVGLRDEYAVAGCRAALWAGPLEVPEKVA